MAALHLSGTLKAQKRTLRKTISARLQELSGSSIEEQCSSAFLHLILGRYIDGFVLLSTIGDGTRFVLTVLSTMQFHKLLPEHAFG